MPSFVYSKTGQGGLDEKEVLMCAIFGVFNTKKAAEITVIGLHANQHRAIDFAGIVSSDGQYLYRERGAGLARQVFSSEMLTHLHGPNALGHLRYPTVDDDSSRDNVQPVMGIYKGVQIAIVHNGNVTNVAELKARMHGVGFTTSLDTEVILRLISTQCSGSVEDDLAQVAPHIQGSATLGILLPDRLIAFRDTSGNRPLSIGKHGDSYAVSSETCAFANVGMEWVRDVEPGEIVTLSNNGITSRMLIQKPALKKCRFEGIYYSHPSSTVFDESVTYFRLRLGRALEQHCPARGADIVTPVPDSATFMALGYGESGNSGRYLPVITRNHYVGRTFIAATQAKRDEEVSQKFNFSHAEIVGRSIVVIDDSIVRGTTSPKIVALLRQLKAREVHVRIGSPPITHSCRYGINTPKREKLIASHKDVEEIRVWMGADSLGFLPLEVLKSLSPHPQSWCFSCMTGEYW